MEQKGYEPQISYVGRPELALVAAIFRLAVIDAEAGDRDARQFLQETGVTEDYRRYFAQQPKQDKRRAGGRKDSDPKKLRNVDISKHVDRHAVLQNGGKNSGLQQ